MNTCKKCKHGVMIYNTNDQTTGKALMQYGEYSEKEVELFKEIVKKRDIIIECGANIGVHTIPLIRLTDSGFVYAFEPEINNFYALCGNIALNNLQANAQAIQAAIGKEDGYAKIPQINYNAFYNSGGVTVGEPSITGIHNIVAMFAIDSLNLVNCNLLKIDVEGMEFDVLCGATTLINKHKPVIYVEYHSIKEFELIFDLLTSMKYNLYLFTPSYFNENNYENNKINTIIDSSNRLLVSCMLLCVHSTQEKNIDIDTLINKFNIKKITNKVDFTSDVALHH